MNNEKVFENKKEDYKALKRFVVILIISSILGGVVGFFSGIIEQNLSQVIADGITKFLTLSTPYINIALTFLIGGIVVYFYMKARKLFRAWNGEDEEQIDYVEMLLNYAIWASNILMILAFFFFAAGFATIIMGEINNSESIFSFFTKFLLFMFGFILANVFVVIVQQKTVNFLKEINPEKQGSVFDTKFAQKWIESCDEAERLNIYQSAYKSYKAVTITCVILLMLSIFGMMIWDIGVLPAAMVTIIWLVQTSSYCMESIRLSKRKNKR